MIIEAAVVRGQKGDVFMTSYGSVRRQGNYFRRLQQDDVFRVLRNSSGLSGHYC